MLTVSNVYKTQKDPLVTDHGICNSLIIAFTGQLKGLWNNTLTEADRTYIKTTCKK